MSRKHKGAWRGLGLLRGTCSGHSTRVSVLPALGSPTPEKRSRKTFQYLMQRAAANNALRELLRLRDEMIAEGYTPELATLDARQAQAIFV